MKVVTLDEFFGRENVCADSGDGAVNELSFTGNWYIDAGILGFVNLMEEVYGWDLEELQKRIIDHPKLVYYWYFPIAFVYYNNKLRGKTVKPIPSPPREFESPIDIFEKAWEWSYEKFRDSTRNRIDLSSKEHFYYLHNLLFFQPNWDVGKQKSAFMEILRLKEVESGTLKTIDKTINKFLPSADEFSNIPYSGSFITLENLLSLHPFALVFTLTFPIAFIRGFLPENILFYSPNLEFTYYVNKKLIKRLEKVKSGLRVLQITWRAVIDSILETKSIWTLENMYLLKYRLGKNQAILSAEYIGVPKLQASIILDDTVRDALNRNIPTPKKERGRRVWIWILEEFIKNKPLLPPLINYLHEDLNNRLNENERTAGKSSLIYINCVDAQLKEFGLKSAKNSWLDSQLFGNKFFKGYREILFELKETAKDMFSITRDTSKIFNDDKEREKVASRLLSTIRKRSKYAFANILLKSLIKKTGMQKEIKKLNSYLFNKIVSNDISWENYALVIVIGLVRGGVEGGGSKEE